jgi:hypothetical protein
MVETGGTARLKATAMAVVRAFARTIFVSEGTNIGGE